MEVLVALVVFSVAALGSASALSVAARATMLAQARQQAVAALLSDLAVVAATPCAGRFNREGDVGGVRVRRTVEILGEYARVEVSAPLHGASVAFSAELQCD